ncbi:glutathione S-transferase [Mesorhizobium loti]|uniref:Glutathione S-transferase n=1 Tax=Rhizobium loti TaxID=381 RepID=A0A117N2G8_RHILI|nr:glutathione S-transferase [Mesorhizobium loti]
MYKAVGSRGSRVSRVLWMLEELGQPYEFAEVKLRSPEAYALNPSGKVPILIDGDLKITDSAAICVYLADKHADKGMGMHFAQSELEAPLWNKLRHRFLLPKEVRVDVGPAAAHDFASEVKALDRRLGDKPFALGDRFSAVDVLLGDMGGWARAGRFRIESERVNAYFDRVLSRPARARAQANASARKS